MDSLVEDLGTFLNGVLVEEPAKAMNGLKPAGEANGYSLVKRSKWIKGL